MKSNIIDDIHAALNDCEKYGCGLNKCQKCILLVSAVQEIDKLQNELDRDRMDVHNEIRLGYDKTVADSWRAEVARKQEQLDLELRLRMNMDNDVILMRKECNDLTTQNENFRMLLKHLRHSAQLASAPSWLEDIDAVLKD